MSNTAIALFEQKQVRKVWHDGRRFFSIDDIVMILVDSQDIRQYIKKMKSRDPMLASNRGTICTPLEMTARDNKQRRVLCADTI
ncbi:hypothetical protein KBC70_05050 [Candidatus Woesebacteria bacterium]|nr:hypothetical protein [Candidatus Woesebacteria bacterium]